MHCPLARPVASLAISHASRLVGIMGIRDALSGLHRRRSSPPPPHPTLLDEKRTGSCGAWPNSRHPPWTPDALVRWIYDVPQYYVTVVQPLSLSLTLSRFDLILESVLLAPGGLRDFWGCD